MCIYTLKDLLKGIGSCSFESWEVQDMQWVSWSPRRANGIYSSCPRLKAWAKKTNSISSTTRPNARKNWYPSGTEKGFFSSIFYHIHAFNGLSETHSHWRGQSAFLSQISSRNTLTDTPREILLSQISGHPVTQSSWYIKWAITVISANKGEKLNRWIEIGSVGGAGVENLNRVMVKVSLR